MRVSFSFLFFAVCLSACRAPTLGPDRSPQDADTAPCRRRDEKCQILRNGRTVDVSNPHLKDFSEHLAYDGKSVRRLILLGEMHGTNEVPALTAVLVKELSRKFYVNFGVEYPSNMQKQMDEFMLTGNESVLLKTKFFQNAEYHSGRGSRAMVALLEALRRNPRVHVFCFDIPYGAPVAARDTEMAERVLKEARKHKWPDDKAPVITVTLSGNIHARLTPGYPNDPTSPTMGSEILRLSTELNLNAVTNVNFRTGSGSAWECVDGDNGKIKCGSRSLSGDRSVYSRYFDGSSGYYVPEAEMREGYMNTLYIRQVSTSKPLGATE